MPHRMLNVNEVAHYLHLSRVDVDRLVKRQEIPFEKTGDRLLFRRKDIDVWASQRILGFSQQHLNEYHIGSSAKAHDLSQQHAIITELLRLSFIEPALTSRTKPSILRDMVKLAETTALAFSPEDLQQSLEEREAMCSTALPGGVALLHPRHHEPYMFDDSFIVFGKTSHPVPFGALDGKMTDLFFLICCQDDRIHLHVLARLCMMCSRTPLLTGLREGDSADSLFQTIQAAEEEVIRLL